MDRIANELGWVGHDVHLPGCGQSEGDFSLHGWIDDLRAAIDHLEGRRRPDGIWLVGTTTGGSLAVCVGRRRRARPGRGHARGPGRLRRLGRAAPPLPGARPRASAPSGTRRSRPRSTRGPRAASLPPPRRGPAPGARPLLVLHGDDDDTVPVVDARLFAQAHGLGRAAPDRGRRSPPPPRPAGRRRAARLARPPAQRRQELTPRSLERRERRTTLVCRPADRPNTRGSLVLRAGPSAARRLWLDVVRR